MGGVDGWEGGGDGETGGFEGVGEGMGRQGSRTGGLPRLDVDSLL